MLRVAVFEPMGNMYGSERSLLDLLRNLPRDQVRTVVYCPREAGWLPELRSADLKFSAWFR